MNGANHGRKSTALPLFTSKKTLSKLSMYFVNPSSSYSFLASEQKYSLKIFPQAYNFNLLNHHPSKIPVKNRNYLQYQRFDINNGRSPVIVVAVSPDLDIDLLDKKSKLLLANIIYFAPVV